MKKIIPLILVLILFCTTALAKGLNLKYLNPNLYPVTEGAELTVFRGQDGNNLDYAINPENDALEKLTGVKINWVTAPGTPDDWKIAFNMSIASGNYPDIYLNDFTTADVMSYANDVFIPLNDYIEDTYWIKRYMEEMPKIRETITAPDGNIYCLWGSLPNLPERSDYSYPYKLWIFIPWLESSGLEMPETIDEYREFLRYVRDHDMNGNGDTTDELPMFGSYAFDHDGSDPTYGIMQSFVITPQNFLWADEDHNVTCVAITDEFRNGLIYLNSLFEEGLIPEDIYALTLNEFRDVVNVTNVDDTLVASAGAPEWWRLGNAGIIGSRMYDDYAPMPVLKKDKDSPAQTLERLSSVSLKGAVTVNCKDPALAVAWLDACMDPELALISSNGNEGDFWIRMSVEGELPIVAKTIEGTDLKEGGAVNTHTFGGNIFPRPPAGTFIDSYLEPGSIAEKAANIIRGANRKYMAVSQRTSFPPVVWNDNLDLITEHAELAGIIRNNIRNAYAEFILGRRDIKDDAVWEAYKENLESLGLSRYIEITSFINFGK